jgi:hypothetical protein
VRVPWGDHGISLQGRRRPSRVESFRHLDCFLSAVPDPRRRHWAVSPSRSRRWRWLRSLLRWSRHSRSIGTYTTTHQHGPTQALRGQLSFSKALLPHVLPGKQSPSPSKHNPLTHHPGLPTIQRPQPNRRHRRQLENPHLLGPSAALHLGAHPSHNPQLLVPVLQHRTP